MPHIRAVTPDDLTALLPMIAALARHHGDTPCCSAAALSRDLFGPDRCLSGLIARDGGGVTGYTLILPTAQAQFGTRGIDLHHLWVKPRARGRGFGAALVAQALVDARARGCSFAVVGTHPDNLSAQAFWLTQGFARNPDAPHRFRCRLDGDARPAMSPA